MNEATQTVEYINPKSSCPAQGQYSHLTRVKAGTLLFVAGQLSVDQNGEVAGTDNFDRQFHQVFENMGAVLEGMGVDFNDVAKFTTYLVHSQDIGKFKQLRAEMFPKIFAGTNYPPNTLLIVDRLVKEEFLIEVEAVVRARD